VNQLQQEPDDGEDEDQPCHQTLPGLQRPRQANRPEDRKSKRHHNQQHAHSISVSRTTYGTRAWDKTVPSAHAQTLDDLKKALAGWALQCGTDHPELKTQVMIDGSIGDDVFIVRYERDDVMVAS